MIIEKVRWTMTIVRACVDIVVCAIVAPIDARAAAAFPRVVDDLIQSTGDDGDKLIVRRSVACGSVPMTDNTLIDLLPT
jgi:hypothetical protein